MRAPVTLDKAKLQKQQRQLLVWMEPQRSLAVCLAVLETHVMIATMKHQVPGRQNGNMLHMAILLHCEGWMRTLRVRLVVFPGGQQLNYF